MKIYRQGDVLLTEIATVPSEATKQNNTVLAYGEATGHSHMFPDLKNANLFMTPAGKKYIVLKKDSMLTHQEHNHFMVEAGTYEVTIEREYDYFDEEMKKVID